MYNKVVVPLDGSDLAEVIFPHLEEIAKGCSIPDILLISVTEKIEARVLKRQADSTYVPEKPVAVPLPSAAMTQGAVVLDIHTYGKQEVPLTLGKMGKTAADYLCRVAQELESKGFCVTATVLYGNPAEQIVGYAKDIEADLIIMASVGKSKVSKWDMSHVTEKVIKKTRVPVLLVKPERDFVETKPRRKGVAM